MAELRNESPEDRVSVQDLKEKDVYHSEVLVDKDLMNDAFQGENKEHEQSMWQAVKTHKMACFWAFVFCFTIVSTMQDLTCVNN